MSTSKYKQIIDKIKLIIFDMDGVLVDVSNSYRRAIKETVEHFYKKEISYSLIQELKDLGGFNNDWELTFELLNRQSVRINKEKVIEKFQSIYWGKAGDGLIQNEPWLIKRSFIDRLYNRYELALFTGRPRKEAIFTLKLNSAFKYLSPIVAMEDVQREKPDPYGIEQILKLSTCKKEHTLYLGDTIDDAKAAKLGGIYFIGVSLEKSFKDYGALGVISNINDLEDIL